MPPETRMGAVTLRLRDLGRGLAFWSDLLGLETADAGPRRLALAAPGGGAPLVVLEGAPDAPARPPGAPGLFHVALRVPHRAALARALRRLQAAGWPLQGASDHRVSEALYLADPEGNGVELTADRPREAWAWNGGELRMTTDPLDVADLLAQDDGVGAGEGVLAPGTDVGHVHLRVSDLGRAEAFWGPDGLGLAVTTRRYPGALFLSAGGYHHHVGVNVWGPRGGAAPPGAAGLAAVTVVVPGNGALEGLAQRLGGREDGDAVELVDPDGLRVRVTAG